MPENTAIHPPQAVAQAADAAYGYIWSKIENDRAQDIDRLKIMGIIIDELKYRQSDIPQNRISATKGVLGRLLIIDRSRGPQLLRLLPGFWRKARVRELAVAFKLITPIRPPLTSSSICAWNSWRSSWPG